MTNLELSETVRAALVMQRVDQADGCVCDFVLHNLDSKHASLDLVKLRRIRDVVQENRFHERREG